ncbi:hypothetical protein R69927_03578 [Paraburkholderia domus]|uniref:DUF1311 domain-containing protein n=1 Tax=Paraburkholderia domus TaxID=2793075 RepID=A0A9N8QYP3_9BURK|nr:hypothetical protein [Paraburkholderia domus]MBK5087677.1 hypothetical protein [Burkholderia sp. R-69927]MBK5123443.1 hypothetical protein [Burkholderia sp. R-69980]MBK5162818.1 hypothetical protein [Burkholderia sp. R-70211]MBK5185713.1 hypothetical protein [Burkholderia sp. R-69749]MCI0150723.1 hypothetical protein [Paraburkholderia sediminicola]
MKISRPIFVAALMLTHLPAHATRFDCNRGRSLTERMICNDPSLSKLDDTLGQLYWKARRRVINRRAFLTDSDSKWTWREANCRDAACLGRWYATRIEELQRLIEGMQTGKPAVPAESDVQRKAAMPALQQTGTATLQCTAPNPGIVVNDQCSTVIKENNGRWKYQPHGGDWFCGLAMLSGAEAGTAQ